MTDDRTDNVGRIFDAHARALVLYARQWLDEGGARDAVQEAFVRLLRREDSPPNMLAWLYRAVRSAAIDGLRSEGRRQRREREVASERSMWFESGSEDAIDAAAAQTALATVPEKQREVIVLRLWSGLTLAEIAELCQTSVSTVFSRYRAGLAAARKQLEQTEKVGRIANPSVEYRSER
jgi:RNA polymerase sigma-70 factor (ECF subfamily)